MALLLLLLVVLLGLEACVVTPAAPLLFSWSWLVPGGHSLGI